LPLPFTENPEFVTPDSFVIRGPIFKASLIKKLTDLTLFYMFFQVPNEKHQAEAAEELYRR
jgi:hypothetical protein